MLAPIFHLADYLCPCLRDLTLTGTGALLLRSRKIRERLWNTAELIGELCRFVVQAFTAAQIMKMLFAFMRVRPPSPD